MKLFFRFCTLDTLKNLRKAGRMPCTFQAGDDKLAHDVLGKTLVMLQSVYTPLRGCKSGSSVARGSKNDADTAVLGSKIKEEEGFQKTDF